MPEPLTIVAGVASILASTLTSAKQLYTWIDGMQHAPEQIYDISQTVKMFEQALLRLQGVDVESGSKTDGAEINLQDTIRSSQELIKRLTSRMKDLEETTELKSGFWERLAFNFRDTALDGCMRRLSSHTVAVQLLLLTMSHQNIMDVKGIVQETLEIVKRKHASNTTNKLDTAQDAGFTGNANEPDTDELDGLLSLASTVLVAVEETPSVSESSYDAKKLAQTWYAEVDSANAFEKLAIENSALLNSLKSALGRAGFTEREEKLKSWGYGGVCPCAVKLDSGGGGSYTKRPRPGINASSDDSHHGVACYANILLRVAEETGHLEPLPGMFVQQKYRARDDHRDDRWHMRKITMWGVMEYSGTFPGFPMLADWRPKFSSKVTFDTAIIMATPPPVIPPPARRPQSYHIFNRAKYPRREKKDLMGHFRSPEDIKEAIDAIRNLEMFMWQDERSRQRLWGTAVFLTLGPPVCQDDYLKVTELFGIKRSLTLYPETSVVEYRDLTLFITRLEDDKWHDTQTTLNLIAEYFVPARRLNKDGIGPEELYFVDETGNDDLMNSDITWDGLKKTWLYRLKRQRIELSDVGNELPDEVQDLKGIALRKLRE